MTSSKGLKKALGVSFGVLILISASIAATLLWTRLQIQEHTRSIYQVTAPRGIESLESVEIGGLQQWIHIRGRNRDNPILLYLHDGPGAPTNIGWFDHIQRPWEDFFTVVQWDQRQLGKSYYPLSEVGETVSLDRMIEDTEALITLLRTRFQQDKIFLIGHSWGSYLGMHIVKRHPEWLHAYVGIAQWVNLFDNEHLLYQRLLQRAEQQQHSAWLKSLQAIGPYPHPDNPESSLLAHAGTLRLAASELGGEAGIHHMPWSQFWQNLDWAMRHSPHLSLRNLVDRYWGDPPAVLADNHPLAGELMAINLPEELGLRFDVPLFFIAGRHDWQTPSLLSKAWFDQIQAPYKRFIWFEQSAHIVVNEEPGKFLLTLANEVKPHAKP